MFWLFRSCTTATTFLFGQLNFNYTRFKLQFISLNFLIRIPMYPLRLSSIDWFIDLFSTGTNLNNCDSGLMNFRRSCRVSERTDWIRFWIHGFACPFKYTTMWGSLDVRMRQRGKRVESARALNCIYIGLPVLSLNISLHYRWEI